MINPAAENDPARSGRVRPQVSANDLPIAGIVPLSTVDWPGRLVATVFVQGCPWRCTYCHNTSLLDCQTPGGRQFAELLALLERRAGLLDGVIFTGGEATRHPALPGAIRAVQASGFDVGLHTGGGFPRRLGEVAPLLSWVGFDVKGLPPDYPRVARVTEVMGRRSWQALEALLSATPQPNCEVRLTVYPGSHSVASVRECVCRALDLGATNFALQEARTADGSGPFRLGFNGNSKARSERSDRAGGGLVSESGIRGGGAGMLVGMERSDVADGEIPEFVSFAELAELVRATAGDQAIIRPVKG